MKKIRRVKILPLILIGVLIGSTLIFGMKEATQGIASKPSTSSKLSNNDNKIANDISNMTGATTQQILKLKSEGKDWNQVLEQLKSVKDNNQKDINISNSTLAQDGLDKDFLQKLKNEGFKDQEITEVKMLSDRVSYELNEITSQNDNSNTQSTNKETDNKNNAAEDLTQYEDLAKKIQMKDSIYYMLKLKNDFSSYEKVFDEYLYSLQVDLKLDEYITDKKTYESKKKERDTTIDKDKIITLAKIEEKALEQLQKRNNATQQSSVDSKVDLSKQVDNSNSKDISTQSPLPIVENKKPENPNAEIIKEINNINEKSMNP